MKKDRPYWKPECLRDKTEVKKWLFDSLRCVETHPFGRANGEPAPCGVCGHAGMLSSETVSRVRGVQCRDAGFALLTVWVADDKAKTTAWLAKKGCFQQAAADLVQQDPVHWCEERTCSEDQGNINRDLHQRMARRLRCRQKKGDVSPEAVGYCAKNRVTRTSARFVRGSNTLPRFLSWCKQNDVDSS